MRQQQSSQRLCHWVAAEIAVETVLMIAAQVPCLWRSGNELSVSGRGGGVELGNGTVCERHRVSGSAGWGSRGQYGRSETADGGGQWKKQLRSVILLAITTRQSAPERAREVAKWTPFICPSHERSIARCCLPPTALPARDYSSWLRQNLM